MQEHSIIEIDKEILLLDFLVKQVKALTGAKKVLVKIPNSMLTTSSETATTVYMSLKDLEVSVGTMIPSSTERGKKIFSRQFTFHIDAVGSVKDHWFLSNEPLVARKTTVRNFFWPLHFTTHENKIRAVTQKKNNESAWSDFKLKLLSLKPLGPFYDNYELNTAARSTVISVIDEVEKRGLDKQFINSTNLRLSYHGKYFHVGDHLHFALSVALASHESSPVANLEDYVTGEVWVHEGKIGTLIAAAL